MNRTWIIVIIIVAALIIMQFFQPERNQQRVATQDDIFFQLQVDQLVKKNIVNACYDCHSNNTRYPFYANFAPVSWLLAKDIRHAKEHVNFSEWGKYDKKKQLKILTEICDELTAGEMPLKSYVFMHSNAILNDMQVKNICDWTDAAAEEVFKK